MRLIAVQRLVVVAPFVLGLMAAPSGAWAKDAVDNDNPGQVEVEHQVQMQDQNDQEVNDQNDDQAQDQAEHHGRGDGDGRGHH